MTKEERFQHVLSWFAEHVGTVDTELHYNTPYELLVAVMLSAQCTDKRVNMTTPALFARFPDPASMAAGTVDEIRALIKSISYPNSKADHLHAMAVKLMADFGGVVPDNMDDLQTLPGVGRKTANLILGDLYGKPAIVADTHCIRLSNRIGLVDGIKEPGRLERALRPIVPPAASNDFCHRLVLHGRAVCTARKPMCGRCCLREICKTGSAAE